MSTSLKVAQLPSTVQRYLELRERGDANRVADLFAGDATVSDEGRTHRGRDEIRKWIEETNSAYEYTTEFLGARETGDMVAVSFRLAGSFPGGVVDLEYQFQLNEEGQIAHLYFA